jgi:hypothetical protein
LNQVEEQMTKHGRIILAGLALIALSACGNAQFEEGFNKAFEKSTKESCVSSAAKTGAPADQIEPYCTCFVGQLSALSTQQKMKLNPSSPELKAAVEACRPK